MADVRTSEMDAILEPVNVNHEGLSVVTTVANYIIIV
jgi:hypothetical protein